MKSEWRRTFCEKEFNRQEVQLVWEQSVLNRTPFASEPKRKTRVHSRVNFGLRRSGQPTNKHLDYPHISQQSRRRTQITVPCNDASAQRPEDKLGDPVVGASPEISDPVVPIPSDEMLTTQIRLSSFASSRWWSQPGPNPLRRRFQRQRM